MQHTDLGYIKPGYDKPGRFKLVTRNEIVKSIVKATIEILDATNKGDYFSADGVISGRLSNKKLYKDERIVSLEKLCLNEAFMNKDAYTAYAEIMAIVDRNVTSLFKSMFVNKNPNVERFFTAIRDKNLNGLDDIQKEIVGAIGMGVEFLAALLEVFIPTHKSEKRMFNKSQALSAAIWWLHMLQTRVPEIIRDINDLDELPVINLTEEQKRIFVTSTADTIWSLCQHSRLNISGQSPLSVGYRSKFVQDAMALANIKFDNDEKFQCGLAAHLYQQSGEVSFEDARRSDNVEIKNYNLSDNLIMYRDSISTITTAAHIGKLPRDIINYILLFARPELMPLSQAKRELEWNTTRLLQLQSFFKRNPATPLLKIPYVDPMPLKKV